MRIATWNVNSVRARLERLVPWLAETRPEIVLLQETKCVDEQFPREPLEELGYQIAHAGQKTYNGVAILARERIEDVRAGLGDARFDGEARVLTAQVGEWLVASVYAINGQEVGHARYHDKLAWYAALRAYLAERFPLAEKVVVGGDLNVTRDDLDVHDPRAWHERILCSAREREALAGLLGLGLEDGLRHFHPEGRVYTWWDYYTRAFERGNKGLRIDYLLFSPRAQEACTAVEVDLAARAGPRPSDHAPVVATLEGP
ncbi:MAG TPA: exodeoxyribonuclease III [Planctomycetota bacterium]